LRLRLKENFDRFNFAIYKEKEMADFRRLLTALCLVALFVGLASAQGGINGGSTMACSTTTTVTPTVRSEGFTELVGDIVLNCTGGSPVAFGQPIPQANITVFLNTQVTSRVLSTTGGNVSEALLMIDEPGSSTVTGYGPGLGQMVCSTPLGGCLEYVGNAATCNQVTNPSSCGVPSTGTGAFAAAPNVFQGVVSGNAVTFYGVPILPPSSTGSRIYRITNIRANATAISGGGATPGSITGSISISPANAFTINQFTFTVAAVQAGLSTALRNAANTGSSSGNNFNQCSGASFGTSSGVLLQYTPNFPTAFKTRTAVGTFQGPNGTFYSNTNPTASSGTSTTFQNVPGQVYNSESGFILPVANGTAGLADWGTRLKAVFSNVPSGVSVYVSTYNVASITTASSNQAQLVVSETAPDATFGQVQGASSTNFPSSALSVGYTQVTIVNGTGTATWEVLNNNYTTATPLAFGVYISYSSSPQTNTPTPGPMSVNMSYAPNPTNGAFSASNAANPASVNIIPRFADTSTAKTFATVNICQTVLLFPFVVTNSGGFETGIAISNTTQDPFGTNVQTGSCQMNWYTAGASGTNPAAGTTPAIPGGTTYSGVASNTTWGVGSTAFTGYMFAICNFQYAHGYAAITDVGARGIFASYLALVVPSGTGGRCSSGCTNGYEMFSH